MLPPAFTRGAVRFACRALEDADIIYAQKRRRVLFLREQQRQPCLLRQREMAPQSAVRVLMPRNAAANLVAIFAMLLFAL